MLFIFIIFVFYYGGWVDRIEEECYGERYSFIFLEKEGYYRVIGRIMLKILDLIFILLFFRCVILDNFFRFGCIVLGGGGVGGGFFLF